MNLTQSAAGSEVNLLGRYLRDRRIKSDPGIPASSLKRRRTPGLRREEVASRSGISTAWYISLEQGRGGAPSADVLDRISRALRLNELEREHLFIIGLGRPPEMRFTAEQSIEPRLQRILDRLCPSPALVKTATWDVLGWNDAWLSFVPDFAMLPVSERNMLRFCFRDPRARTLFCDWEAFIRYAVAVFRAEAARAGATVSGNRLVKELQQLSPEFRSLWADHDLRATSGAIKHLRHPILGVIPFESSTLGVDASQELLLVVSDPISHVDADRLSEEISKRRSCSQGLERNSAL